MESKSIIESNFTYKGYKCCVIFQPLGHRCGYVLVPHYHKFYEKEYSELGCIKCHGGITYSSHRLLGQEHPSWWIGFDCAHWDDLPDVQSVVKYFGEPDEEERNWLNFLSGNAGRREPEIAQIRTLQFCEQECRNIVDQLIQMEEE